MSTNDQSLWYLENIDVRGIFCPNKMSDALRNNTHAQTIFNKGDYIYLPEEDSQKIFLINDGKVKIGTFGPTGKEITKAVIGPGEVFGELALVTDGKRKDFAIAVEKTNVCAISRSDLRIMMRDHSSLSLFLMQIMGNRQLEMEQRLESLVFKDSRTRIIEFVHNLGDKKGQRVGYEIVVRKFMTHQEIANLTATSRQTVTTVLNELRNRELITFNRRRLLIRDMDTLAKEGKVAIHGDSSTSTQ